MFIQLRASSTDGDRGGDDRCLVSPLVAGAVAALLSGEAPGILYTCSSVAAGAGVDSRGADLQAPESQMMTAPSKTIGMTTKKP